MNETNEGYKPRVPAAVRDVVYYVGVLAGAAGFIFVDDQIVARSALAIGFIASSLGVAYRPGRST